MWLAIARSVLRLAACGPSRGWHARSWRQLRPLLLLVVGLVGLVGTLARPAFADPGTERACRADDALTQAAAELLLEGRAPVTGQLDAVVRAAGSDAVRVRALYLPAGQSEESNEAAVRAWLQQVRRHADAELACGDAQGSAGRLLIAAATGGSLAAPNGEPLVVRGTLASGFTRAELVIQDHRGQLVRYGVDAARLERGVTLDQDLARPATIQLVASGPLGPRPVAERVAPAERTREGRGDVPSATSPLDTPPAVASGSQSAPESLTQRDARAAAVPALLDQLRKDRGVLALRRNRLLTQVASAHASAACAQRRIAHELTRGEDPKARLLSAGIEATVVGEVIARADHAPRAFSELQQSPSHLLTLLDRRFTDAGYGSAHDDTGKTCLVVLLAAWPRYRGR